MTDSEIAAVFVASGNDLPCGRFLEAQLNRTLIYRAPQRQSTLAYWGKRIVATLLLTPILSGAKAQQKVVQPTSKHQVKQPERRAPRQRSIKGQVLDNMTHQPVPGVKLSIATLQLDTVTDHKGRFVFILPEGAVTRGLTIASPYNISDSFVVLETAINDSAITHGQEVVLYRHEVQRVRAHEVITHETMIQTRPYSGVPVIQVETYKKRRGLRGIFNRKHS